ncbi:hypothetical protein NDU88_007079 [Pleurodeles waltl]|uniref:Uncharacterized protein n=1 Tax=Pleurodeles waltl TaxID=8319 RepID=A0AAV7UP38_PLEWA|nr:hypothetical protein NDU88_007079 [Pleurodeles waltl]
MAADGAEARSARHFGSAEAQSVDLDRGPRVFGPRPGELLRDLLHPRSTGEHGASGPGSASRLERPLTSKLRPAPLSKCRSVLGGCSPYRLDPCGTRPPQRRYICMGRIA